MSKRRRQRPSTSPAAAAVVRPNALRSFGGIQISALTLALIVVIAYYPAVRGGFIWDDDYYVSENPALRTVDGLRLIWFETDPALRHYPLSQYYPLVFTSFWIQFQLWGLNVVGYHLVNIALHALNAVLLWRILLRLAIPGAWLAAAVFALHPVHVESVAWITELKNVQSAAFCLAAMLLYLRACPIGPGTLEPLQEPLRHRGCAGPHQGFWDRLSTGIHPRSTYAASLILFLCALLSKSVTCSLPAVLVLLIWWKHGRLEWVRLKPTAPFFALGLAFGLLTAWMEKACVGARGPEWDFSLVQRMLIAGRSLWFYPGKLLWPMELSFIYPRWEIDAQDVLGYLYPAAAVITLVGLWLLRDRIGRGPLVTACIFSGVLLPALGFINIYPMRYTFVADHYQYLASIALITVAVAAINPAQSRPRAALGALLVCILGTLTWRQAHVYRDIETLWRDTLAKNPDTWLAHNNLANILDDRGDYREAYKHYLEALRIRPDYAMAHNNLAIALIRLERQDEAIRYFRQAIQMQPDYTEARFNLAKALLARDEFDEAVELLQQVIQAAPRFVVARRLLAEALAHQARFDLAERQWRAILEIDPHDSEALARLKSPATTPSTGNEAEGKTGTYR